MADSDRQRFELCCHIVYIVECIATGLTGEAKFQLNKIIVSAEESTLEDRAAVLDKLRNARDLYKSDDYHEAAVCITSASRMLFSGLQWGDSVYNSTS
jgi:hypothetical protein